MEDSFKKIREKTKAFKEGREPFAHTFEGALFKDANWPFIFQGMPEVSSAREVLPEAERSIKKSAHKSLVLFVGDTYSNQESEDLLGKMIKAMKLEGSEFYRLKFNESLESAENLAQNLEAPSLETLEIFKVIKEKDPQIVVSLGATVTNVLLGRREKLSSIHGQFFTQTIKLAEGELSYELMPIFHPDFLLINPNMKRTAWIDLQKVMELVGKN